MVRLLISLSVLVLISSCQYPAENRDPIKEKKEYLREYYPGGKLKSLNEVIGGKRHGLCKYYYETGELKAVAHFHMNQYHGEQISYYRNGKVRGKINYHYNKKQGEAIGYYEDGSLYTSENYEEGKLHGMKKKYWDNGNLMMENSFFKGKPSIYLKEYDKNGKLITNYPKLNIIPENTLYSDNTYRLRIFFDSKPEKGKYYVDELADGVYLSPDSYPMQNKYNEGIYKVAVQKGQTIRKTITVIGEMRTKQGNTFIATRKYKLEVKY